MAPRRFMAVDAGSNSIKYRIWQIEAGVRAEKIAERRFPVRLGAGVFSHGTVNPGDYAALLAAFHEINTDAQAYNVNNLRAVATSAMREAANGAEIAAGIKAATGIALEILPDATEARLIALGVLQHLPEPAQGLSILIDIGGGSSEVILARGAVPKVIKSLPLGAVRMRQKYLPDLPPLEAQLVALEGEIQHVLKSTLCAADYPMGCAGFGMAGTITAIIEMLTYTQKARGECSAAEIDALFERVKTTSATQIENQFGLEPRRAEIILPGIMIARGLMHFLHLDEIKLVNGGVSEGLLEEYLGTIQS